MIKKSISILIAAAFLAVSATGCDKKKVESTSNDAGMVASPETARPPQAPFRANNKTMYVGINNEGADFGSLPGKDGSDWKFPTTQETDYWLTKGVNTFRVGVAWEREQPSLNTPFVASYNNQLLALVSYATSKNINVLINPQNFMRWNNKLVGSSSVPVSAFVDFWTRMSTQFKDNPRVLFGLNNEPNGMSSATLLSAENQAIVAIRATGAQNIITVPGNGWTGVASFSQTWVDNDGRLSNSALFNQIKDSSNNWMIELHHYPDSDAGGEFANNTCSRNPTNELVPVVAWLRANGKKVFIGEYGAVNNTNCQTLTTQYLQYISANSDVIAGMTVWAAGPIWGTNPVYKLTLEPTNLGKPNQADEPRTAWYQSFWASMGNPTSGTTTPVADAGVSDSGTVVIDAGSPVIVDAGVKDSGAVVDAGAAPAYGISLSFAPRTPWSDGTCIDATLKNNSKGSLAWHEAQVNLGNGKLRDMWNVRSPNAKWGSTGTISFKPTTPMWIGAGKTVNFGFCEDTSTPKVLPTVVLIN